MALNIPNVDELWKQAVDAGCEIIYPLADQFYGDRGGRLRDPFGHQWMLSTHIEDVEPGGDGTAHGRDDGARARPGR